MIAGVILAGGRARRMGGGDKPLLVLKDRTLLDHVILRLAPQVDEILLNANGAPERFASVGLAVRADALPGYGGPLVGVLTGLAWAREKGATWLASVAGDTPFFPLDLVSRLMAAAEDAKALVATAKSGTPSEERDHPVFAVWSPRLLERLHTALVEHDVRKVRAFTQQVGSVSVSWPAEPFDPFYNVNTHEDMAELESLIQKHPVSIPCPFLTP